MSLSLRLKTLLPRIFARPLRRRTMPCCGQRILHAEIRVRKDRTSFVCPACNTVVAWLNSFSPEEKNLLVRLAMVRGTEPCLSTPEIGRILLNTQPVLVIQVFSR